MTCARAIRCPALLATAVPVVHARLSLRCVCCLPHRPSPTARLSAAAQLGSVSKESLWQARFCPRPCLQCALEEPHQNSRRRSTTGGVAHSVQAPRRRERVVSLLLALVGWGACLPQRAGAWEALQLQESDAGSRCGHRSAWEHSALRQQHRLHHQPQLRNQRAL